MVPGAQCLQDRAPHTMAISRTPCRSWTLLLLLLSASQAAVHKRHTQTVAVAAEGPAVEEAVSAAAAAAPSPWGLQCPDECTCLEAPFKEVPLRRLLSSHATYVLLENDALRTALDANRTIRQAACVILSNVYEDVMAALPHDTQALTLLQSADEAAISLTTNHLSRFKEIVSLDMTAFAEAGIHLRSDALRTLPHLRLLSLTGVDLEGAVEDSNEVLLTTQAPTPHRRRRLPPWAYRTDGQMEDTPQLVFLKPAEVVSFSKFSEIRRVNAMRSFEGLENLVLLQLHHAGIRDLAWEMFNGLDQLQVLSLESNGLAYVPDWSLYGAPSLRYLSLAHNELLDVSSTALVGLLELQYLDLSHNNLSHLSELSLPPFPKLRAADFRGNPIEAVFTNTFQVMNSTETLLLGGSGTALQLHADMFLGLRALRRLSATDVSAVALHRDLLRGMPRARDLTLRGVIYSLPYDAFVEVPKLERLVLSRCGIRHVSMDAFYALFALQELDLSHNQLTSLPPSLLDQQTKLREVLLTGNKLKELPIGMVEALPAKMVRLDGNPWDCSCDMAHWNPAATNKERREGRYVYDKKAAPSCATPAPYAGWDVYDAMRRGFRCNKNPSKRLRVRPDALNALPADNQLTANNSVATADNSLASNRVVPDVAVTTSAPVSGPANGDASTPGDGSSRSTMTPSDTASMSTDVSSSTAFSETSGFSSAMSSTETPSLDLISPAYASSGAPQRRGPHGHPRRGKNHHPHKHGASLAHEHAQHAHAHGQEGSQTKDGKYLLSDGKGGYHHVSRKAYKAAMEERRRNAATTTTTPHSPLADETRSSEAVVERFDG